MSLIRITPVAALLSLAALACHGDVRPDEPLAQSADNLIVVSPGCTTLWAGQNIDAGQVCISHDATDLFIEYQTTGGWGLEEVHAWAGTSLADMPTTPGGNPKIGNFPYKAENLAGATSYTFTISLSSLEIECDASLFAAAHAALSKDDGNGGTQTETGWADGDEINDGGSWATFFQIDLPCDPPDEPEPGECETAYAFGDQTFIDLGLTQSRWGWQLGPLAPGSYSSPIYAGAGQNDITKGTEVGTLDVDYDGSSATVTYDMLAGYTLDETHLYVGTSDVDTIAPGQLGDQHDLSGASSDSFTVTGFSGEDIYVVAHAVSCEGDDESTEQVEQPR